MAKVDWPPAEKRTLIGKRIDRVDGPFKATGAAKYSYDVNRPDMLWARVVTSPYACAVLLGVESSAVEAMPGVKAVWKDTELIKQGYKDGLLITREEAEKRGFTSEKGYNYDGPGPYYHVVPELLDGNQAKPGGGEIRSATLIQYAGQIVAAVAATTEEIAEEAARLVKVQYKPLEHQVRDADPTLSKDKPSKKDQGNVEEAFSKADKVVEGEYGIPVITHCCLESHGQVTEVRDGELYVWASTQNVSRYSDQLGASVGIDQNRIHVDCQFMGGGFGSKFSYDKWGIIGALLSKQTGKPVKLMLERDEELVFAGNRPSAYAKIKTGAQKDGTITAIEGELWGTGGMGGWGVPNAFPYVFTNIPNQRVVGKAIRTNRGGQRAWRAPHHPQSCFLMMSALADTAASLRMDELEFFQKNISLTGRPDIYAEELKIAAELIDYKKKAHLRGDPTPGPIKRGLGLAIHTWGGMGHGSECDVTINPDGSVEAKLGSQDLGTGTRTVINIVVAETLGLPLEAVKVQIGKSDYPGSGGSGGSTTVGGVSASSRLAATAALNALLEVAAPKLGAPADNLEASGGQILQTGKPDNKISWKDACALLGPSPITKRGVNTPGESQKMHLIDGGVGGAQIADVSVDMETGIVTVNEMVAVQDCGLIIDLKTAESQVYGGLIMGISYALFEEAVYDTRTGRMLNADMEFYRLAGIQDVGRLKVHMMTGRGYDERGVVGLGEPPVISPGAAIANAVTNAIGVRVPRLPLTPDRVIAALEKGGVPA